MNHSQRTTVFLDLLWLVGLALGLRLWGLDFGLPACDARPDEMLIIGPALKYGTGDLNPHFFRYPSLLSYLLFAGYGLYWGIAWLTGGIAQLSEIPLRFAENPTVFFVIARLFSALLGAASVAILYLVVRRIFNRMAAVAAALALAVVEIHVRHSHFGVTDIPMSALVLLTLLPLVSIVRTGGWSGYIGAGLCAGLAVGFKYNAACLVVPLIGAHVLASRGSGEPCGLPGCQAQRPGLRRLGVALLIMGVTFWLTTPFGLLEPREFLRDLALDRAEMRGEGLELLGRGWIRHAGVTLPAGMGWLVLIGGGLGWILAWLKQPRQTAVCALFPLTYFILQGSGYAVYARHAVPLVAFVCLGWGVLFGVGIGPVLARWLGPGRALWATALILIVALCPVGWETIRLVRLLNRPDTRAEAMGWVTREIPAGTVIGWVGTVYGRPWLPESAAALERELARVQGQGGSGRLIRSRMEVAKGRGGGYEWRNLEAGLIETDLPDWILTEEYPLSYVEQSVGLDKARPDQRIPLTPALSRAGEREEAEMEGRAPGRPSGLLLSERLAGLGYEEVWRAEAFNPGADVPGMIFDRQDSFYLPLKGLSQVRAAGPTLVVYFRAGAARK